MSSKISFLDVKDLKKIKEATESHELKLVEDDEIEKNYYDETAKSIKKMSEFRHAGKGWNYFSKNYAKINFYDLLKNPYFGSIKIKNEDRAYIGKQSYFDININKTYIHDWRSTFGDIYYGFKKHTFIEQRNVEIDDVREYVHKYIYFDKSKNLTYFEF